MAFGWVRRQAAALANKRGLDAAGVRRRYRGLVACAGPAPRLVGLAGRGVRPLPQGDQELLARAVQVLRRERPAADENNDLEQFFGSYRYHERRCGSTKDHFSSSWTSVVRGGDRREFVVGVLGVLAGDPAVAGDGVGVRAAEPAGLPDAVPLGDVLQVRPDLLGRRSGIKQGRPLAPGGPALAGATPGRTSGLVGAVAAGHGRISGPRLPRSGRSLSRQQNRERSSMEWALLGAISGRGRELAPVPGIT